jgi:hypothetical protein
MTENVLFIEIAVAVGVHSTPTGFQSSQACQRKFQQNHKPSNINKPSNGKKGKRHKGRSSRNNKLGKQHCKIKAGSHAKQLTQMENGLTNAANSGQALLLPEGVARVIDLVQAS